MQADRRILLGKVAAGLNPTVDERVRRKKIWNLDFLLINFMLVSCPYPSEKKFSANPRSAFPKLIDDGGGGDFGRACCSQLSQLEMISWS